MKNKLGIIVPYRNREKQLNYFLSYMETFFADKDIDYNIIVVEQKGDSEFNRGSLLNIGFLEAEKLGCNYVAFHDVDMLPKYVDYSYPEEGPTQLADKFLDTENSEVKVSLPYDYFGGVTLFKVEDFRSCNGYDNNYWGWGFEDNDLLLRCREKHIPLQIKEFYQDGYQGKAIRFDGRSSYLECKSPLTFNKQSHIIYVDFVAEDLKVNTRLAHDEGTILAIPGLDLALCRESFNTYKFEFFDNYEDCYSLHTECLPPMRCKAIIFYNAFNKTVEFILNKSYVGTKKLLEGRKIRIGSETLRFGAADPSRKITDYKKFFKGYLIDCRILSRFITADTQMQIIQNGIDSIDYDLFSFVLNANTDLNTLKNNNCTVETVDIPKYKSITTGNIRPGIFLLQKHEGNGAFEGSWKNWNSRVNQARYNEFVQIGTDKDIEGLSNVDRYFSWKRVDSNDRVYRVKAIVK